MANEIEKGKAIIQLAQMIIIFSGFLFALGGVSYTNSVNTLSTSLPVITIQSLELVKIDELNLTAEKRELIYGVIEANEKYLDTINPQLELTKLSFWIGGFGVIASVLIWNVGYWKIRRHN